VPAVRPVILWLRLVEPALLSTPPAGLDVTVYPVIAEPPMFPGAVNVTVAEPVTVALVSLATNVAVPIVGAAGTVAAVSAGVVAPEALPVPIIFVAVTVKV
jgi:hypothetical protein